jgi:hypothetical protein
MIKYLLFLATILALIPYSVNEFLTGLKTMPNGGQMEKLMIRYL